MMEVTLDGLSVDTTDGDLVGRGPVSNRDVYQ